MRPRGASPTSSSPASEPPVRRTDHLAATTAVFTALVQAVAVAALSFLKVFCYVIIDEPSGLVIIDLRRIDDKISMCIDPVKAPLTLAPTPFMLGMPLRIALMQAPLPFIAISNNANRRNATKAKLVKPINRARHRVENIHPTHVITF